MAHHQISSLIFFLIVSAGASVIHSVAAAEDNYLAVIAQVEAELPQDRAIGRALEFLRSQQRANGQFGSQFPVASTSLAVMAHFAAGFTPQDIVHGAVLTAGIDAVLASQRADGYFGATDGSRMYGHGISTLMLAEAIGMLPDEEHEEAVRLALERAVALTIAAAQVNKSAKNRGGWRYQPEDRNSDLSLSGWQLMSLHASAQVGILVPEEVITAAVGFARRVTTPDGKVGYESAGEDHPALRGAALLSFSIGGAGDSPEVARIVDRVIRQPLAWQGPWLFYRSYYDAVALSRVAPEAWQLYAPVLDQVLVDHQAEDGSWPVPPGDNEAANGEVYRTAMAVLALAVGKHVLPAYQR